MLPRAASEQYRRQQAIAVTATASVAKLWGLMSDDFDESYRLIRPRMLATVEAARTASVASALDYTGAVLAETGQVATPTGDLVASRFLESTPDGRTVAGLVDHSVVSAKRAVAGGAAARTALFTAGTFLTTATLTLLADTRRDVYSADIIQRPTLTGYVRMLNPPSCSRCAILAGKWFRWNEGFQRHPECDCQHIPAREDMAGDLRTDPYEYFQSLSKAEQDRIFTIKGAEAIRDGADIYRVTNIQMRGLGTSKQALKYGTPTRFTVDDIYRIAGTDRNRAIQLLQAEGYITGPQVRGGNIVGAYRERFTGLTSVPRAGSARARVLEARQTGVRDPLDPATMTAAERRIYDDFYRLNYARKHGQVPRSVGLNSADYAANSRGLTATPERLARLEADLQRRIARVKPGDASQLRLLEALGLTNADEYRSQVIFDRLEQLNRQRFKQAARAKR